MGRILSIDFGTKRCGIAVTDPDRIIATGLSTIATEEIFDFLEKYISEEQVDIIVIGDPKQLDGSENDIADKVERLSSVLTKKYPSISIVKVDERYTSKMAQETLIQANTTKKKRRDKGLLDKISATIILQSYLEQL